MPNSRRRSGIVEISFGGDRWNWFALVAYMVGIMAATLLRWMNYANLLTIALLIACLLHTKKLNKSVLCFGWSAFILIYPMFDFATRNDNGYLLFQFFCYLVPLMLLMIASPSRAQIEQMTDVFRYFAYFQAAGIVLGGIWPSLYNKILWTLLGFGSPSVSGFSTERTVTAFILCVGFGVSFTKWYLSTDKWSIGSVKLFLEMGIFAFCMVDTSKRSFLVSTAVALVLILFFQAYPYAKKVLRILLISFTVIAAAMGVAVFSYLSLGENNALGRMGATMIGLSNGEDVSNSRSIWANYMTEWKQGHEVFGIGWENFQNRILDTQYVGVVPNGHCIYRQLLCETGYVGFAFFVIVMAVTIFIALRNIRRSATAGDKGLTAISMSSAYIVIVFAVYGYFGNPIYDTAFYLYFFIAVVFVEKLNSRIKKRKKK